MRRAPSSLLDWPGVAAEPRLSQLSPAGNGLASPDCGRRGHHDLFVAALLAALPTPPITPGPHGNEGACAGPPMPTASDGVKRRRGSGRPVDVRRYTLRT